MQKYYLGIDVSEGYADFVLLGSDKKTAEEGFQSDDTFEGHCRLYERLGTFFQNIRIRKFSVLSKVRAVTKITGLIRLSDSAAA